MAITWQATDTIEPAADTDIEQAANAHLYGVISGCAVTFDASDMTYDVAAGTILHNGSFVSVAAQANAGTLTADGTNPRWAYIYLDSTGTEGLTHGTAAADPAKPEIGDNVAIAAVLIAAGATVANSQTTLDKRVWTHGPSGLVGLDTTERTSTTVTTNTDLSTISGLNITVDQPVRIIGSYRKSAAAVTFYLGIKVNGTLVATPAGNVGIAATDATNEVQSGVFEVIMSPRSATFLRGLVATYKASGATAQASGVGAAILTADIPNATITSIAIVGYITGAGTMAVKDVRVYAN